MRNNTVLEFSFNWNHKLDCYVFTTIRKHNDIKYSQGMIYDVFIKKKFDFVAEFLMKKTFAFKDLSEGIALIDTGYDLDTCRKLMKKMYPGITPDTKFDLIFLRSRKWALSTNEVYPPKADL